MLKVEIHKIEHGALSTMCIWPRENVVELLERGSHVVTIRKEETGGYRTLGRVNLVRRGGRSHLRVDEDIIPVDDLGKIPDM